MPLSLTPDATVDVCLKIDEALPIETRPVFVCKVQTMRGQLSIASLVDRWTKDATESVDQLFQEAIDLLKTLIVGWRNMGDHKYSEDIGETLKDLLTYLEARELINSIQYAQNMTEAEKKS